MKSLNSESSVHLFSNYTINNITAHREEKLASLIILLVTCFINSLSLHNNILITFTLFKCLVQTQRRKKISVVHRRRTERQWQTATIQGEKEGSCGGFCRYLKVWYITKGLRCSSEASCAIGQVSYCAGKGSSGWCMDHSNIATGRGKLHIDMVTYSQASILNISALITRTKRQHKAQHQHEGQEQVKTYRKTLLE